MADKKPLSQKTLKNLRKVVQEVTESEHTRLPLNEVLQIAGDLDEKWGITIDVDAAKELGQPLIIAQQLQSTTVEEKLNCLSPREREVAMCVAQGMRNKEIAQQLHIALSTVKDHVHNILEKLELSNRTALTALLLSAK